VSDRDPARLFLALWPGATVRARLASYRDAWRWPEGARPVADETLHVTLHFIGALARSRLPDLARSLAAVPMASTVLRPGAAQVWPGGIAILGIDANARLAELHERLGDVLRSAGIALDARPFAPHVTLARKAPKALPPPAPPMFRWPVGHFVLVESIPGAAARYEVLSRFGAAPQARSAIDSG